MKKLTIIIPVYNGEEYIEKALNSILIQKDVSFSFYEVLVINDGSTDKTLEKANNFIEINKLTNFKVFTKNNGHWGSVINYIKKNKLISSEYF